MTLEPNDVHVTTCRLCDCKFKTSKLDELPIVGETPEERAQRWMTRCEKVVMGILQHMMQKHPQEYAAQTVMPGRRLGGLLVMGMVHPTPDLPLQFCAEVSRQFIHQITARADLIPSDEDLQATAKQLKINPAKTEQLVSILKNFRSLMLGIVPTEAYVEPEKLAGAV
jgi:hypothetical protein